MIGCELQLGKVVRPGYQGPGILEPRRLQSRCETEGASGWTRSQWFVSRVGSGVESRVA